MNQIHESWQEHNRSKGNDLAWMAVLIFVMAAVLVAIIFASATSTFVM
jgi:hypothetical protein